MSETATGRVLTSGPRATSNVLPFWRAVYEIARKEVLVFARTRRIYVFGSIFSVGLILVTILFANLINDIVSIPGGGVLEDLGLARANVIMAFAYAIPIVGAGFWLMALGIVFSFDAIVREYEDKSLFLILSKPVTRHAFVLGKYFGATFTVSAVFLALATVCYFIVQLTTGSFATFAQMGRYYLGVLMIILAMAALAALALFGSAITRSTVTSIVFSLAVWIVGLNVISNVRIMYIMATRDFEQVPWIIEALEYTNPSNALGPAAGIIVNADRVRDELGPLNFLAGFGGIGLDPLVMFLSLVGFIAAFVGASLIVVNRRNFE